MCGWFYTYATLLRERISASDWTGQIGTHPWASRSDTKSIILFVDGGNKSNPAFGQEV